MHGNADETALAIRAMRGRVDGLLVMSPEIDADFLAANLPTGLPVVVMGARLAGAGHTSIVSDNHAGAWGSGNCVLPAGMPRRTGPRGGWCRWWGGSRACSFCRPKSTLISVPPIFRRGGPWW